MRRPGASGRRVVVTSDLIFVHTSDVARGDWIPFRAFDDAKWAERSWGAAAEFWKASPNQLWPDDHAWLLASEIDFDSTVIGGTRALIDELTTCDAIEAVEIPAGASLTQDADTIN